MDDLGIKSKLERTLHTRISLAEWQDLKDARLLDEHQRGELSWLDFRHIVDETLGRLRRFLGNVHREQTGELKPTGEIEHRAEEAAEIPDVPASLGDRAFACGGHLLL